MSRTAMSISHSVASDASTPFTVVKAVAGRLPDVYAKLEPKIIDAAL